MEEILASIRTIIADERNPGRAPPSKAAPQRHPGAAPGPQIVYANDAARPATEPSAAILNANAGAGAASPKPFSGDRPAAEEKAKEKPREPVEEEPLLSPETSEAVASAFETLSANLAARSTELAEELAREMFRPMLKAWLDDNLPAIVERLVGAEIEQLVRGKPPTPNSPSPR